MASPHSPSLDRSALSHVLGLESQASSAAATIAALPSSTTDDMNGHINNNVHQIEDNKSKKNRTSDTDTDSETDKDSSSSRAPFGNNSNKGNIDGVHSTKTAASSSSSSLLFSTTAPTTTSTSRQEGLLHKDLPAVDLAHYKDFATSESGRKRKRNLSDLTTAGVSESTSQNHTASSSSKNVAIALSSVSPSSIPATSLETLTEPETIAEQDRYLKRIKADHVGDKTSTGPLTRVNLTGHSSSSRNGRERKHKLSDDLVSPIMSGTSTPGRHSASPSRSAISVSTPSSSVPAASVSPFAAQGSREQDHHLKRPRVYDVDDDSDNDASDPHKRRQDGPIVIDDDDDENDDAASDKNSNQADYNNSFTEQDDSIINLSVSVEDDADHREPSPARSDDSDATITQSRVHARATTVESTAAVRASSVEHQAEPATSPRQDFSRNTSTEPQPMAPTVHTIDDDPDNEEVIEVIDLTPQARIGSYPRGDNLARVPGLSPQHSFQLPTLQRLVSRSSQSMERSQTRRTNWSPNNSIDIQEIPDHNDDDYDDDFYGRDTVRIDSEVREVQLDPHHPWSRGPIQLIFPSEDGLERERQQRPQIEDVVDVDDHLPAIDYAEINSDSEEDDVRGSQEVEDDEVNERQVDENVNYILNLRRDSTTGAVVSRQVTPMPPPRTTSQRSFPARSPSFNMRSPSYEAQPITFPTTSRRSATPHARGQHRYNPVARRPSPVRLILRDPATHSSSSSSSSTRPSSQPGPSSFSSQHQYLVRQGSEQRQFLSSRESTPSRHLGHSQPAATTKETTTTTKPAAQRRLSSTESSSASWMSQHLKCSICMDTMNIPTMLRCGHAFCRTCIHMALNVTRHCPMCRQPTTKTRLQELEFHVGGGSSHPVGAAID